MSSKSSVGSDHSRALVPVESWWCSSPDQFLKGKKVDAGLFAESLVYYDSIFLIPGTQDQFAALLAWCDSQGALDHIIGLFEDGTIRIYHYDFATLPMISLPGPTHRLVNLQGPQGDEWASFTEQYESHDQIKAAIGDSGRARRLFAAIDGKVIEARAKLFSDAIDNAHADFKNPRRSKIILQSIIDGLYRVGGKTHPPHIEVDIEGDPNSRNHTIGWNIDMNQLLAFLNTENVFDPTTLLSAGGISNRLISSASAIGVDLFLSPPMSSMVGDKLYEALERNGKLGATLEDLKGRVEFPDLRVLVNNGNLPFSEILKVRRKSKRIRQWLQEEADRDRDAIFAYHNEVSVDMGWSKVGRRTLGLFGALGSSALGAVVGGSIGGTAGVLAGASAGGGVGYLANLAMTIGEGWKPIVFGDWLRTRIERYVGEEK